MTSSLAPSPNITAIAEDRFLCHRGPVTCACPIPNSPLVCTSAYDCAIGLFNTLTHNIDLMGYHAHLVNRVSVDARGKVAASCSSNFNIHLWDIQTRKLTQILRGHSDEVEDFIFIDDFYGASVSRDSRILLWNLQTGAIEHIFLGHTQEVLSISYLDDKLYTFSRDMTLCIWDLVSLELVKTLGPFDTEVNSFTLDPIHRRAVLGCDDGFIRIVDINSGNLISSLKTHHGGIKKVTCSPHNGDILCAAHDQRIFIWGAVSLDISTELQQQATVWERSLNWSGDGKCIYAGTFDGTLLKWNAANGQCGDEYGSERSGYSTFDSTIGNACFNDVAILNGNNIVAVSDDGFVRTGKLSEKEAAWQHIHAPENGRIFMNAVVAQGVNKCIKNDSSTDIITGTHAQSLKRFSNKSGGMRQTLSVDLQQGPINCIRVAQCRGVNDQYFVACYTGVILQVGLDGQVLGEIRVHKNAVKALALHPSNPIGVSCDTDGVLVSWDFTGQHLRTYLGHQTMINDVDISANGELIASVGRDFTLNIHRLADGALVNSIGLGRRAPKAVTFIGNDVAIVGNSGGELLRIDLKDSRIIRKQIAESGISAIAIRENQVVVSSYDGGIYLLREHDLHTLNSLHSMTQRINNPTFEY